MILLLLLYGILSNDAAGDLTELHDYIANAEIETAVSGVCEAHGFICPVICMPEELLRE
jgi:hypothetical protein